MGIAKSGTVNTVEAKNNFNALVARAEREHRPIIVEKRGIPVAVILDYQTYCEKIPALEREKGSSLVEELERWHEQLSKENPCRKTSDSVDLIRELREERDNR